MQFLNKNEKPFGGKRAAEERGKSICVRNSAFFCVIGLKHQPEVVLYCCAFIFS